MSRPPAAGSALEEIREAERELERRVAAARDDARRRVAECRQSTAASLVQARERGRSVADQRFATGLDTAHRQAQRIQAEARAAAVAIGDEVRATLSTSVERMVEVILPPVDGG